MERLARELKRREARQSLLSFTEFTNPLYHSAEHHRRICEKLEAVERGDIDRLMIFMPPRHGKSELASKRFPAWCLGRNADAGRLSRRLQQRSGKRLRAERPQHRGRA
jgi:hypothetical protein